MPRKPAASLTVLPPSIPGQGRPEPPAALDGTEARIWRGVVAGLPDYWVDGSGEQVLRRLVCQAAIAERQEARLRTLRTQPFDQDDEIVDELAASHRLTAHAVGQLLGLLRATPKSRLRARDAAPKLEEVPASKPWDVRARRG
jgi:hypothetical protein